MSLAAVDVSLELGGRRVLKGVDLSLAEGGLLAVLGPNGAGKSSLLRVLAGVQMEYRGEVNLDGAPLATPRPATVARRIGYLAQDARAAWPMRVREVVALGRLPWRGPWSPLVDDDVAAIDAAMRDTDVFTLAERPVTQLSGGERARVLLARVLAGTPEVILADEPVAGLDPAHQLEVMQLLAARAHAGASVAVVLHDLTLAVRYADRVALMSDGALHAIGTPTEVLTDERMKSCFGIRVHSGRTSEGPFVVPVDVIERKRPVTPR